MLYQNTLLKTFQQGAEEVLIKEESLRKDIANMIYCFYTNNKSAINYYLKLYMMNSGVHEKKMYNPFTKRLENYDDATGSNIGMFTEKTVNIMPKIHIDLVNKILDMVCTIYNAGADRYLLDSSGEVDEKQTEILMNIYNGFDISKKINEIYKQGYLFNCILIQPVWRDEKIDLDIITPNFCSVDSYDYNQEKAKSVMIAKSIENEDMIVYWDDSKHNYIDIHGTHKAVKDNEGNMNVGMVNPYKELPFAVLRFQSSSDFWGEPQQDLVENNIWYDVRESNNMFVEMFQGLGVGIGINLGKNTTITNAPNTIILVNDVRDDMQTPSLEYASTNAPMADLRENLDLFYKKIGNSKGLSPQSMANDIVGQSGVAKAFDSYELSIKKDSHKHIMKQFEKELFEKIKLVYNYHTTGDRLSDEAEFTVDIFEDEPETDVKTEIEKTNFNLDKNIISIVDLMIQYNPDLNTDEAIRILEENKKLNETYLKPNVKEINNGQAGQTPAVNTTGM